MPLPVSEPDTLTNYYMIPLSQLPYPENYLPLVQPLLSIPVVGKPLADLLEPVLTPLVNWGYGDPNFGWSTSPADIPTQFGFLPPLSATMALGPLGQRHPAGRQRVRERPAKPPVVITVRRRRRPRCRA